MSDFNRLEVIAPYEPAGDQGRAIEKIAKKVKSGVSDQVLLGVTGSGKTFTMAKVIEATQKPTLVIAHNKTLAAQLYQELRDFLPNNAVSYFVSYYDYYQPEAYIATTDTYIEKEATINDEIDRLRLSTTANLLTRPDAVVVASVSCIYNLGSPVEYGKYVLELIEGQLLNREVLLKRLTTLQYEVSGAELKRGGFRIRGDVIQLWPAYEETALKIDTFDNKINSIVRINPVSGEKIVILGGEGPRYMIYPAKHYLVNPKTQADSIKEIEEDCSKRVAELEKDGKKIEVFRLNQKVGYDLEQIREFGFCNGIENYSRYFDGRKTNEPPFTLLEYFWENQRLFNSDGFLTIVDESHITLPQIRGMYFGDQARKGNLINYGFRLPSALDNRPLQFDEFLAKNQQLLYVSATPDEWELKRVGEKNITEQLVRPTGLLDPEVEIRPTEGQILDLIREIGERKKIKERTLVTVLTKKMAETLSEYLNDETKMREIIPEPYELPKVAYLHSDIETLERSDILNDLRSGVYDVLVGINLLREGLDLPEVSLVAILDADKEGFLRSRTSLIQTMGRAARHLNGRVILYADVITKSMQAALDETARRRAYQIQFNTEQKITPQSINKEIRQRLLEDEKDDFSVNRQQRDQTGFGRRPGDKEKDLLLESRTSKKSRKPLIIKLDKQTAFDLNNFEIDAYTPIDKKRLIPKLEKQMRKVANEMDFEMAAIIRDVVQELKEE